MEEEPCQCPDCQRFYKEHDRLIREFPTFKDQKELNWASIQSFRTLCNKVTEELQKQLSEKNNDDYLINDNKHIKRFKKKINKNKKIKIEIPKEINEILVNMVKYR